MRFKMSMFCLLIASACATSPRPIADIPGIRHQIDDTIEADRTGARRTSDFRYETVDGAPVADAAARLPSSRRIKVMGRIRPERAVVYTQPADSKLEETWVREPDGWKLSSVKELGPPSTAPSSAAASR
jgi:hypothetical protein